MKKTPFNLVLLLMTLSVGSAFGASDKKKPTWEGTVPKIAQVKESWSKLVPEMEKLQMWYGEMAASARLLVLFNDIEVKEFAYKTIISLADQGYPFGVQPYFLAGDLSPSANGDYDFANSYNLYKAILNKDRGLEKWATHYFENVDKKDFTKFSFFNAIEAFGKEDFKTAEEELRKILTKEK